MNLPPNIAALTQDPLVVDTIEVLVAFFGREDLEFKGANLRIAQRLADADALTPHALAVLILTAHMDIADVNDNADSLPDVVVASAMAFLQPLAADAKTRDWQDQMLMADTTASMLHLATHFIDMQELRGTGTIADDDEIQSEFYLKALVYQGVMSLLHSDDNLARYPLNFLRLCVQAGRANNDQIDKLNPSYFKDSLMQTSIEMSDCISHLSARAEGYTSAFAARQAFEAAVVDNRVQLQAQMRRDAQRFKL